MKESDSRRQTEDPNDDPVSPQSEGDSSAKGINDGGESSPESNGHGGNGGIYD